MIPTAQKSTTAWEQEGVETTGAAPQDEHEELTLPGSNITSLRELTFKLLREYDLIGLANNVANDDPGPAVPGVGVSGRGAGFNINGLRAASTNVLLDGVDNNNVYYAASVHTQPT